MSRKIRIVRTLLCAYPKRWRSEYGCEFASTLYWRPLTMAIIVDVFRNGLRQRLRYAAPWHLGGLAIFLWLVFGTILNSFVPLSTSSYSHFFQIVSLIYLAVGYGTALLPDKSLRAASLASGKAAAFGIVPELLLASLWAINIVHPTILDMSGSPHIIGYGIIDLCIRSDAHVTPSHLLILLPLVAVLPAMFVGYIGATIGKTISAFKIGLHNA